MDQTTSQRLEFRGLTPEHKQALAAARPFLEPALVAAVKELYRHMRTWPSLMGMFANEARRQHAEDSQLKHWTRLFTGEWGAEYQASVARIGATHSRIGLEPQWFLGAYAVVTTRLLASVVEAYAPRLAKDRRAVEELNRLQAAIQLATNLDMDLVVAVYLEEQAKAHRLSLETLSLQLQSSIAETVTRAVEDVESTAHQIQSAARDTRAQTDRAAGAVKDIHQRLQSVAAALEEVTRSIDEIRGQTSQAKAVAEGGVGQIRGVDQAMGGLEAAVQRINEGVVSINDIAERTNILAINASIEAARAGIVGKGFAVVASEVRKLAGQTVEATATIGAQTADLSSAAHKSLAAVRGLIETIASLDKTSSSIAGAVDEQGVVTQEITRDAQVAADQSRQVDAAVDQLSGTSNQTEQVAQGLHQVVGRLRQDLEAIRQDVKRFLESLLLEKGNERKGQ